MFQTVSRYVSLLMSNAVTIIPSSVALNNAPVNKCESLSNQTVIVLIYDQSMKRRQAELITSCSCSQFRIIRQFLHFCNSECHHFRSVHKRSILQILRPSKHLRQSPMDHKLVVTIPMDLPLSAREMSILKQLHSIIPTPHTVDEFEMRCDFEKNASRMHLFAHFHENPFNEQSHPCKDIATYTSYDPFERLIPKTTSRTPPEGHHPSLDIQIPN